MTIPALPVTSGALMRICLALAIASASLLAAGSPENALLVVNGDSWASVWIANEYVAARDLPRNNVLFLHDLPDFERIGVDDFRSKILQPVLATAQQRGLAGQLDYVLYSADIPWAVDVTPDMAGKTFPKPITQPASLTGLTYLYQFALAKDAQYLAMGTNFYFRPISRVAPEAPWPQAEQERYMAALKGLQEVSLRRKDVDLKTPATDADKKQLIASRDVMLALLSDHPKSTELLYNLACVHAQLGEDDAAIGSLRKAMDNGWWDMRHARRDTDLRSIHERADFTALVQKAKSVKFEMTPTSGFRGSVGWSPNFAPVKPEIGVRYLISTMLGCTSGRGMSAREVVMNLRRSIGADGTRPKGTIYFMENGDVRSTTREWGFARTAEKLREIGVNAVVESGVLPKDKRDVAGAVIGAADFDWSKSGSRITPGAIVEHLTSFGGVMTQGSGQTPLTEFLRHGAAGASGTVTEPYAVQPKFPSPFIQWHYAQGCTLGEAFYQSIAAPYQLLIVGDALCAPWKKEISVSLDGAQAGVTLRGPVNLTPSATSKDGLTASFYELYFDGTRVGAIKEGGSFGFDTAKANDGPHEITVVASASDPIATTARISIPIITSNAGLAPVVAANASGDWPWDKPIEFTAKAPGAKGVSFIQHSRGVAQITGEEGTTKLDPRILGQGPVTIRPVAVYPDGKQALAKPIALTIVPPAALPAMILPSGKKLVGGMNVSPAGLPAVVSNVADGDWLEKAGVQKDGAFFVEAWFSVDADEVYQFQIHGPAKVRLIIDEQIQDWPRGKEWWFVPVRLAPGLHKVQIDATAEGKPRLDVRFGGPGAYKLAVPRFQHPEDL